MCRWLSIALLAATVSVPFSAAQMRAGRPVAQSHGLHHAMHRLAGRGFPGAPFFYSDYDANLPYAVEEAPPQVVLMQPAPADDSSWKPRPAPLLIEWRGDRYVRFGGAQDAGAVAIPDHPDYAEPKITKPPTAQGRESTVSPRRELPPAVLVYRDGHREEISDYAIANGVIYIQDTYWQNGSRIKPIPLAALDPIATTEANQQRGVRFMLPSASNVVIASF